MIPFRRSTPPEFPGDFPAGDRDMPEALQRADYDGTTWAGPALPAGVTAVAVKRHGQDTEPLAWLRSEPRYTPPAAILAGTQAPWVMTVDAPRPGGPGPTQAALDVVGYLRAKVAILRRRGQLDRISQDKLAMLPADRIRNRRTTARLIVDEAAELLLCGGDTR